jgi:hypothetical protein
MAVKKIQIHGRNVSKQGPPTIYANVTTTHTGWSGTTPLYRVHFSLLSMSSGSYFGFELNISMNGEYKQIKGNSPSTWKSDVYTVTFENVPKGTGFSLHSSNCGCDWWDPAAQPDYDSVSAQAPGVPGSQKVNGATTVSVLERNETLKLTWTKPGAGTHGISGYKLYYSVGSGWKHFATVGSGTLSYSTSISSIYNNLGRGGSIGFQITAYNDYLESAKKGGAFDNNIVTIKAMTIGVSNSNVTPIQAKISWSSNINVQTVKWRLSSESSWRTVSTGLNAKSGSFNATGLAFNTNQVVYVHLTAKSDGSTVSSSTTFKTLDIARITAGPDSWSIEDFAELTISNKAGCTISLYLSYNNVEVISRTNIELTNGKYKLVLTDYEKNMLYVQASSDKNPSFKFILKSYISGTKVGEMSRVTLVTFPTKAWVKVNNVWKRALVWGKINNTWKQCIPWVDPNKNKNWKKI